MPLSTRKSLILTAAGALLLGATSFAAIPELLSPSETAALPPQARASYGQALESADRLLREKAASELMLAASFAPDSLNLQRITAEYLMRLGDRRDGEEAIAAYENAVTALDRISAIKGLSNIDRADAVAMRDRANRRLDSLRAAEEAEGPKLMMDFIEQQRDRRLQARGITGSTNRDYQALIGPIPDIGQPIEEEDGDQLTAADVWSERGAPGSSQEEIDAIRQRLIQEQIAQQQAQQNLSNQGGGGFGSGFGGGFGGSAPGGFGGPAGGFGGAVPGGMPGDSGFGGPQGGNPFGGGATGGNPFGGGSAPGGNPFGGGSSAPR